MAKTTNTNTTVTTINKYTYKMFAQDCIKMAQGLPIEVEPELFIEKAEALYAAQEAKATYNANRPKKSTAKGPGEKTKATIALIAPYINAEPKTAAELSALCGTELTALQVSNAAKFIEGVVPVKVVREAINAKGLKSQKEYTAYKIEQ